MNEPQFKSAAFLLAEKTPKHLGQPTLPPILWRLEEDVLVVLLADGRKVRAPIADQKRDKDVSVKKQADPIVPLPFDPSTNPMPSKAGPKEPPKKGRK